MNRYDPEVWVPMATVRDISYEWVVFTVYRHRRGNYWRCSCNDTVVTHNFCQHIMTTWVGPPDGRHRIDLTTAGEKFGLPGHWAAHALIGNTPRAPMNDSLKPHPCNPDNPNWRLAQNADLKD
jgi:hypothetical protein